MWPQNYEERLTIDEAIAMHTTTAAFAGFEENQKGTLEIGKLADITRPRGRSLRGPGAEKIKDQA
jgi:predicted amidohydrolase YtcJ